MSEKNNQSAHWADMMADRIIREKGDKELYTCASGITPSGTVHIGNFREIITVDLVVRALRSKGKTVRFIYSWDDYDVFRKVPKNMPEPELLEKYLRFPITLVPDTTHTSDNYARANEVRVEKVLPTVGIFPEYLYQAERYRSNCYAEVIKTALKHKDEIAAILNQYRTEPLASTWWPVSVFSSFTNKDTTTVLSWDGEYKITYRDDELGKEETIDIRTTPNTKLPWRIDWPMRWQKENVDFEPGGKDHLTEGGSYDTSKNVVKIFGGVAPVSMRYDFIRLKGIDKGKISSSSGEVADLYDVLEVYTPEIVRYLFVGTRPNSEFAISFDLDVLKIYEDYDNTERIYFGINPVKEARLEKEKRIYELSQVDSNNVPSEPGYQIPFRHLCNLLQIFDGDKEKVFSRTPGITESQKKRLLVRLECAKNWIEKYAPEEFIFSLKEGRKPSEFTKEERKAIRDLNDAVTKYLDVSTEKEFSQYIYQAASDNGFENADFFRLLYLALIGKEKGPKLASFLKAIGKEKINSILGEF